MNYIGRIFIEGEEVQENLISSEELIDRWKGACKKDISQFIKEGNLAPIKHEYTGFSFKTNSQIFTFYFYNIKPEYLAKIWDKEEFLFLQSNVEGLECIRPDLLGKPININNSETNQDLNTIFSLGQEDTTIQKENLELKEKLTAYENEEQTKRRTDKATLVKMQKDFEAWKAALPAMLKVYRQCVLDGEKERTEESIRKMFEKSGYEINPSMLKAFKKAMDPAYVKTTPGASKSNP